MKLLNLRSLVDAYEDPDLEKLPDVRVEQPQLLHANGTAPQEVHSYFKALGLFDGGMLRSAVRALALTDPALLTLWL